LRRTRFCYGVKEKPSCPFFFLFLLFLLILFLFIYIIIIIFFFLFLFFFLFFGFFRFLKKPVGFSNNPLVFRITAGFPKKYRVQHFCRTRSGYVMG